MVPEDAPEANSGIRLMREFVASSPYGGHLGIELEAIEPDRAQLTLPFQEPLVTMGDTVHGGAIASLVDTAATVASWSGAEVPENPRGSTVGLTVDFLAPARGQALRATATVIRRGRSLCFCDVAVADAGGESVARALVTYKLG